MSACRVCGRHCLGEQTFVIRVVHFGRLELASVTDMACSVCVSYYTRKAQEVLWC